MSKYRVMSLDQASKVSGFCIMDNGTVTEHGVLTVNSRYDITTRFTDMVEQIRQTILKYRPDHVVIEDTVYQASPKTLKLLAQLQGAIMGICQGLGISYSVLLPSEWRKHLHFSQGAGVKRAELKQQSMDYVRQKYGIQVSDDEADAVCICDAYLNMFMN